LLREYQSIKEIIGPLMIVEGVEGVKYNEIVEALTSNNFTLAHRLVHSLKGNAGQIGKTALETAANSIEILIRDDNVPIPNKIMKLLENELEIVLAELKPLLENDQEETEPLSPEQILELLNRLIDMLENKNPKVMRLLDDVRLIPYEKELMTELIKQIEDYDFDVALEILDQLKKKEWHDL